MSQAEEVEWEQEAYQSRFGILPSDADLTLSEIIEHSGQQKKQAFTNTHNLKIPGNKCVPPLLVEQIPQDGIKISQKHKFLNQSDRNRHVVQQNAKKLLIQESQSHHTVNLSHQHLLSNQSRLQDNNKIQGFYQDESSGPMPVKGRKQAMKLCNPTNFKTNQEKTLEIIRNKRRTTLIQHEQLSVPNLKIDEKKSCESGSLVNKIICKISCLKKINPGFDIQEAQNKKKLLLQERAFKKRLNSQTIAYKRKQIYRLIKNSLFTENQANLALYSRKLMYSTKKQPNKSQSVQNLQKFRQEEKMLITHSDIFQPMNAQLQSKNVGDVFFKAQSKSLSTNTEQMSRQQQAIQSLVNKIKETKVKQNSIKGSFSYQRAPKHYGSLHNIHSEANSRQSAGLKFHWNQQRSKIRMACLKSETVDISKLSLLAEQNRKTLTNLQHPSNAHQSRNKRFKTEPSQVHWKIVTPIFLTRK